MEAEIVDVMQKIKAAVALKERAKIIKNRVITLSPLLDEYMSSLPFNALCPNKGTIVTSPAFSSIILDTPIDQDVDDDSFSDAIANLPQYTTAWKREVDEKLLAILRAKKPEADHAELELATTRFSCRDCAAYMPYTRALFHSCPLGSVAHYMRFGNGDDPDPHGFIYEQVFNTSSRSRTQEKTYISALSGSIPWTESVFSLRSGGSTVVESILALCDLDSSSTTAAQLDSVNPLLQVVNASGTGEATAVRRIMRWNTAVSRFDSFMLTILTVNNEGYDGDHNQPTTCK
jgi:hypothetical protein